MWWPSPGKPTSVSSISPVAGFVGCGAWYRWPCSSSAASSHGLAPERAVDQAPRVDDGEDRADVAGGVEPVVPAAALADLVQQRVLGEEAGHQRERAEREAADDEAGERERHRLAEAAHLVERLLAAHRGDDRAGRHEEQCLEEGVRHQVEEPADVGGGRDGHDHVADLGHRRVGDDALEVGHREPDRAGHQQRHARRSPRRRRPRSAPTRTAGAGGRSGTRRR